MKHKGVIFDLDGTLVDTLGDIAASMNRALTQRGFPALDTGEYRDKVGWGLRRLAFLCIEAGTRKTSGCEGGAGTNNNGAVSRNAGIEEEAAAVAAEAARFYTEKPLVYTTVYPGIHELVSELRQRKMKTAVLTNKNDPVAQLVVAGLFPQGSFNIVQGELNGKPRKPDPACVWDLLVELNLNPAEIIFIGDSEVDIETAVSSGCFPVGVTWGYRSRETIIKAGARHIIEKPNELLELI